MSWAKKIRIDSDVLKAGETVDAVVLGINPGERRMSLGLKQTLGDPWTDVAEKFPVGSVIEGAVTSLTKFGAFVQLTEGVEGMIHVSDMSPEKRINHPQEVVRIGQPVRAQVLALSKEKRQLRLGMKQLVPTSLDEYIAEHNPGDSVTGRVIQVSGTTAQVELGEGIQGTCSVAGKQVAEKEQKPASNSDVSSLSSMLQARWKGGASATTTSKPEGITAGQVRSFRITQLDPGTKKIGLELVP
jgi:small subunit ribosomal protein S1